MRAAVRCFSDIPLVYFTFRREPEVGEVAAAFVDGAAAGVKNCCFRGATGAGAAAVLVAGGFDRLIVERVAAVEVCEGDGSGGMSRAAGFGSTMCFTC